MKNIILLSDGTGNSNIKDRGTNVFRMYEALDCKKQYGSKQQVAIYDDGVGTEDFKPLKLMGGAFGWGLARNVRNLYKSLVQVYAPGDKIYLFGFSRGAFTVRSLAGLIASEGILDVGHYQSDDSLDKAVMKLYENYRAKHTAKLEKLIYDPAINFFFKLDHVKELVVHPGDETKKIEFIGVWDTVDAVGLPFDKATELWDRIIFRFKFPDHKLNPNIKQAFHALSIDDQRQSFQPLLWEADERVTQAWFPGVHANVGGGYPQYGLSLVAMAWMIGKAKKAGLQFIPRDEQLIKDQANAFDKLYDSRAGIAVYYQYQPRDIAKLCQQNHIDVPAIHISAFQRVAEGIDGYAPGNLPDKFTVVNDNGVVPDSAKIVSLVSPSPAGALSPLLLDKVKNLIHKRRNIYYVFLGYSLFTLYWLIKGDIASKGGLGAISQLLNPDILVQKLGLLLWTHSWLTFVGLGILFVAYRTRSSLAKIFADFWSPLRKKLKPFC